MVSAEEHWDMLDRQTGATKPLWGVKFTCVDAVEEEFIPLGGALWPNQHYARAQYDALPSIAAGAADANCFMADWWTPEGHEDDKYVTRETIEAKMGESIDVLLERGRAEIAEVKAEMRARLHG